MARRRKLSNESKYQVADSMAPHFDNLRTVERNRAFGVVINAEIKLNGKMSSLKEAFSEEDAIHITNLILRRIYVSEPIEVSL